MIGKKNYLASRPDKRVASDFMTSVESETLETQTPVVLSPTRGKKNGRKRVEEKKNQFVEKINGVIRSLLYF